jgi:hypothetical protein
MDSYERKEMLYVALLSPDLNPTEIILIAVQGLSELQQFRSNSLSGEEFKGLIFVNTFLSTLPMVFFFQTSQIHFLHHN